MQLGSFAIFIINEQASLLDNFGGFVGKSPVLRSVGILIYIYIACEADMAATLRAFPAEYYF